MKMRWAVYGCLALALVVVATVLFQPGGMTYLTSPLTGRTYEVRRGPDAQRMADQLAFLERNLTAFLDKARAGMPNEPRLALIAKRWDGRLSETEAHEDVAFSVDKTTVSLCLRNSRGEIEDENTAMFVLLHELAHIATSDYGHSPEFWANMRFLLEVAEKYGFYKYVEYSDTATTYCGHPLGASPLTCVKRNTCASAL